jgi:4-hydroxybenzoyl-CoA reductase subunit beta
MEYLPDFRTHRPATAAEAVALYADAEYPRYLAGGTDLVVNVRRGIEKPRTMIDLTAVSEMVGITEADGGLRIGGATTLRDIAENEDVRARYAAVAEAAGEVAGPTHRDYGTLGGNLFLDTRCLYYNQSEWWRASNNYCLKKAGEVCHVAPSGKRCFAAFSGDVAPALLVHEAEVELTGPNGTRRVPLQEIYKNDGMDHLATEPGELLVAVHLPAETAGIPSTYTKARVRGSIDFPLAGVAVRLRRDGDTVADLVVALTAVNPYPHTVKGMDAYLGKPLNNEALDTLRDTVRTQAKPMQTTTVAPWYRRRVVGALARRLAARLYEAQG